MRYIVDIETNGLLPKLDRVHCIVLREIESGEVFAFSDQDDDTTRAGRVTAGLALMDQAEFLCGHNIIDFDFPALDKVYGWHPATSTKVRDTLVCARLIWPKKDRLFPKDMKLRKAGKLPGQMMGRQSLEAWGYRLGVEKVGTDIKDWSTWTPYMQERCVQDTQVNLSLWQLICRQEYSEEAIQLEHEVWPILLRQIANGFRLDLDAVRDLYATLAARRAELEVLSQKAFDPWWTSEGEFTPKVGKVDGKGQYVKGCPLSRVKLNVFNPSSRHHCTDRLMKLRGWRPKAWNNDGTPKWDEAVISALPYPEALVLAEFLMVQKRIAQIAEGKQAWLRHERDGRVHGRIDPNGAGGARMSHFSPNMGQVPAAEKRTGEEQPYGKECRACWIPREGMVLVGVDADGLELRDLAGYLARWDGGTYIATVLEGDKSQGTDMHTVNALALGGIPRSSAKTWFYAWIYGAGDWKLGHTLNIKGSRAKVAGAGKTARASFLKLLPAFGQMLKAISRRVKMKGYLQGLDGRHLYVRSPHAALNLLLQSAGAIQMKRALVIFDQALQAQGFVPGVDYEFVANVHDEWQLETRKEVADAVGTAGVDAIRAAGEYYGFPCPLDGEYKVGASWAETH